MVTKTNNIVFKGLHVVSWIIFISLCIEAGGLLVNFFVSLYEPEWIDKLYQKIDLSGVLVQNRIAFYGIYSFILSVAILKAVVFYAVIHLMWNMDLEKPFSNFVSKQISNVSYYTLLVGGIGYLAQGYMKSLSKKGLDLSNTGEFFTDSQAFILMGAVVYIIAAVFQKGVEMQTENELTV